MKRGRPKPPPVQEQLEARDAVIDPALAAEIFGAPPEAVPELEQRFGIATTVEIDDSRESHTELLRNIVGPEAMGRIVGAPPELEKPARKHTKKEEVDV